jgi:hypothetical protein
MLIEKPREAFVIDAACFDKFCFRIYIVLEPAGKIVERDDVMSAFEQSIDYMGTNKSGSAGN